MAYFKPYRELDRILLQITRVNWFTAQVLVFGESVGSTHHQE